MSVRATYESTVLDTIGDAAQAVVELQEEMTEWRDNMSNANMDHLPKYEQVEQAVDELENADIESRGDALYRALDAARAPGDGIEPLPGAAELVSHALIFRVGKKRQSRADRLDEARVRLEAALDVIDEFVESNREDNRIADLEHAASEMREAIDELGGVEFPGMFG